MQDASSKTLIENLPLSSKIKVWSLLVSVFGDLTPETTASLSGAFLNLLFARMGIKPQALRVALHRLRKDGWIVSEKTGRTSEYQLTEYGLAETQKVRGQIYFPFAKKRGVMTLAVCGGRSAPENILALKLGGNSYLLRGRHDLSKQDIVFSSLADGQLPQWIYRDTLTEKLQMNCQELQGFISAIGAEPENWDGLGKFAYRLLVLHFWRRIILHDAAWHHVQILEAGPVVSCHQQVDGILKTIPAGLAL